MIQFMRNALPRSRDPQKDGRMNELLRKIGGWLATPESPARLLAVIALSIFLVEMGVMQIIHFLPPYIEPEGFPEAVVDGLLLVLLLSPVLYLFFFRPLLLHIEERKRAEEALERERQRLETVTQNLGAGIAIISKDYTTVWMNDVLKHVFGDVAGSACYVGFNKRDGICPDCGVKKIFETGVDRVVHEQRGESDDGRTVWSQIIATPLRDKRGDVTEVLELVVPITERKRAEEALEIERNRLKSILESMDDGVCIVSKDREIQYVNPVLQETFGSGDGRKCYDYFPDRSASCPWCDSEELLPREPQKWEWHCDRNGRTYEIFATALQDTRDGAARLEILHDITQRKEAERAIEIERNKLRGILDAMPDGVYIVDDRFDIRYVNPVIEREFGSVGGRKCYQFFHDRAEVCPWCKNEEVLAGKSVRWEWTSSKTGKTYDLFDTPIRDDDGSICKIEFFHDITDRKKAAESLRNNEELLRTILRTLPVGVWIIDKDGTVLSGNPASYEIWGGARFVGIEGYSQYKGWWADTGVPIAPDEWAAARAIRKGETSLSEEVEIECFDGSRKIILNSAVPIRDAGQAIIGVVIVNQDITERKRMERNLIDSEQRLESLSSHLLEAQEEERRRISIELHDELGQALSFLKLRTRLMKNKLSKGQAEIKRDCDDTLAYIDEVIENVRRLSKDLSPGILEDLGLSAAVRRLAEDFGKHYGIRISVELTDMDAILDDKAQITLYRIFQEALTNIGKHSEARHAGITIRRSDGYLLCEVRDDGVGFDLAERTLKEASERGLGLGAMELRAKMLGGRFAVSSERGEGTILTLTIPIKRTEVTE